MMSRNPLMLFVTASLIAFFPHRASARGDSLQQLIDAAPTGGTVTVPAGRYDGNLVITRRVSLVGVGMPVVRGEGRGSVITITADSCTVRGFAVEHCGSMLVDEDAGILLKSSWNTIVQNELRDVLFGVYLFHAEHNTINKNAIVGRRQLELGERGSGIHIWNSRFNTFVGNTISDSRDGFYIQNANNTWIEDNEVHGVRYGLHYMYADSNVFLGNRFHHNVAGAAVMYSRGIIIRRNIFSHNRGFASFGVLFQDCHGLTADSNLVADNEVGLFFEGSGNNLFRHNVVARNDVALEMFQNSVHNQFTENSFIDNLSPLFLVGKRTGSEWSVNGRGNFWNSYEGYDMDGDGIGDVPMKIQNVFQYLEGQNSSLRLYLYSPASQALAAAGKAFPIIAINEEVDPYPLMVPVTLRDLLLDMSFHDAPRERTHRAASAGLIAIPLIGLAAAGIIYRRLARREQP